MKVGLRFLSFMVVLGIESYMQALVQQAPLTAQEKLIITAEHRAAAKAQALALQQQSTQAKATQQAAQAQAKQVALQQAQEELAQRTVGNQAAKSKAITHVQFQKAAIAAGAVQIPAGQTLTGLWINPVCQGFKTVKLLPTIIIIIELILYILSWQFIRFIRKLLKQFRTLWQFLIRY